MNKESGSDEKDGDVPEEWDHEKLYIKENLEIFCDKSYDNSPRNRNNAYKLGDEKASTIQTTIDGFGFFFFFLQIEYFLNVTNILDDSILNISFISLHSLYIYKRK